MIVTVWWWRWGVLIKLNSGGIGDDGIGDDDDDDDDDNEFAWSWNTIRKSSSDNISDDNSIFIKKENRVHAVKKEWELKKKKSWRANN